jgi:hypothetical protein
LALKNGFIEVRKSGEVGDHVGEQLRGQSDIFRFPSPAKSRFRSSINEWHIAEEEASRNRVREDRRRWISKRKQMMSLGIFSCHHDYHHRDSTD